MNWRLDPDPLFNFLNWGILVSLGFLGVFLLTVLGVVLAHIY